MKEFIKAKTMNAVIEAWRSVEDDPHRIKDAKDLGGCCWEFCSPAIRECPSVIKTEDGFYEFYTNVSREDQMAFATVSYISGLRVVFADKAFGLYGQPVDSSVGLYVEIPVGDRPWMFYSYLISYLCRHNPEYSINREKR